MRRVVRAVNHFVIIPAAMKQRHKVILELVKDQENRQPGRPDASAERPRHSRFRSRLFRAIFRSCSSPKQAGTMPWLMPNRAKPSDDSLRWIVREFVRRCRYRRKHRCGQNRPGHASTVSQAMDDASWPEAVGSIAGEDTIFVAVRSTRDAKKIERRLKDLLA